MEGNKLINSLKFWLINGMNVNLDLANGEDNELMKMEYLSRSDAYEDVLRKISEMENEEK